MSKETEGAAKAMAGEITLSKDHAESMRRWRTAVGVRQTELAKRLKVSPSVVSDYESGRRRSPGVGYVRRLVETLVSIDLERGGQVISKFMTPHEPGAILDIREFDAPVKASRIVKLLDGEVLTQKSAVAHKEMMGYTVIDSIQAILRLNDRDFRTIYGSTTERALVFTKVRMGRSPLIAIKVTQQKPGMIVLHGLSANKVDKLALHIAESEKIPLVVSRLKNEEDVIERLRRNLT